MKNIRLPRVPRFAHQSHFRRYQRNQPHADYPDADEARDGRAVPLIPAAMKLADEILAGPSFEEAPEGVLADETRVVANAKKMFLQAAGGAVQKFREKLADEQELIGALSNVVMEIYAMESCLLRAQKAAAARGEAATQTMIDAGAGFHQ